MKDKKWSRRNQDSRNKQIEDWAKYVCKNDNWHQEHAKLINSIFMQSKTFYDNLLQTQKGVDIVIKKFKIGNKQIIERLKKEAKLDKDLKLFVRENKDFIKI